MLYINDDLSQKSANILLFSISGSGLIAAALDGVLSLGRRSKLLAQSANTIELAICKYHDGKLSDEGLLKKIEEIISIRQGHHD